MKPADNIKKLIKQSHVAADPQADDRILGDALENLARSRQKHSAAAPPNFWRTIMKSRSTKIAAAAIIVVGVIGVFCFLGNGQTSLYAQAIRALEEAQSVHVLSERFQDGQWETTEEIWFDRDIGAMQVFWSKGEKIKVIIEDGNSSWVYSPSTNTAIKSSESGCRQIDEVGEMLKAFENWEDRLIRTSSGDRPIDNIPCQLYVLDDPELPNLRYSLWFDQDRRVRRLECQQKLNQKWQKYQLTRIEYDIPVEKSIFDVNFSPDVKLLDPERILDQDFDPAEAPFSKLISDRLIFAVHDLKKVEGNLLYVLSSIRPTDETKREIESLRAKARRVVPRYLSFELLEPMVMEGPTGYPYQCIKIAEIIHNGMHIQGVLFIPERPEIEPSRDKLDSHFSVSLEISAAGILVDDILTEEGPQGKIGYKANKNKVPGMTVQSFKPIARLRLPRKEFLLEQITSQQYLKSSALESAVQTDILIFWKPVPLMSSEERQEEGFLKDNSLSNIETRGLIRKPSELTSKEYTDCLRSAIEARMSRYQSR